MDKSINDWNTEYLAILRKKVEEHENVIKERMTQTLYTGPLKLDIIDRFTNMISVRFGAKDHDVIYVRHCLMVLWDAATQKEETPSVAEDIFTLREMIQRNAQSDKECTQTSDALSRIEALLGEMKYD